MPNFARSSRPPTPGRRARAAAAAGITVIVTATALVAAPVASSAPTDECPRPYPLADLSKGQPVNGLTVTSGTDPSEFSGEVLGRITDGIAPGLDLVVARLTSPEIDRVGGIWQGMSGSPVYAADGRLVGAVSYGMAWGTSPVAGITPAEEMYRLLSEAPTAGAGLSSLATDEKVAIPAPLTQRLVASGAAAEQQAQGGMGRLPLPYGISGMLGSKRLDQAQSAFELGGPVYASGSASTVGASTSIVAGGNIAASLSYGDVSATGVGTATAVCGTEVLAFGHPMNFTGPSMLSMHGAEAVYIQEDSAGAPFKVANAGAPVGAITQDRLAAIFGVQDPAAVPRTTDITSNVEVPGETSRTGTTRINVPDSVPDIAAFHLLADQDRVFDAIAPGSAEVDWSIAGTRADGRTFVLARGDRFASDADISYGPTAALYDQLAQLQFNGLEEIRLGQITTRTTMTREDAVYSVARARVLERGLWRDVRTVQPLFLRGGTTRSFRVVLTSDRLPRAVLQINLVVPRRIGYKSGALEIMGGNSYEAGQGMFDEFSEDGYLTDSSPTSFGGLVNKLRREPRNDEVLLNLSLLRSNGTMLRRSARGQAQAVVNGALTVPVQGVG